MTNEEKQLLHGKWEYIVACQKELRQLELQILNNISVPLDWLNANQFKYLSRIDTYGTCLKECIKLNIYDK